jgi:hypothetical protein
MHEFNNSNSINWIRNHWSGKSHVKRYKFRYKNEIIEHIDKKFTIDDICNMLLFFQFTPLNATGIRGKNNFKDRTYWNCIHMIMGDS